MAFGPTIHDPNAARILAEAKKLPVRSSAPWDQPLNGTTITADLDNPEDRERLKGLTVHAHTWNQQGLAILLVTWPNPSYRPPAAIAQAEGKE
jgi:hypothetical protein